MVRVVRVVLVVRIVLVNRIVLVVRIVLWRLRWNLVESRGISSCDDWGGISWISVRVWRWGRISSNDWVIAEKLLESADRAHNCQKVHVELFIDEMGWSIDDLYLVLIVAWPRAPRALWRYLRCTCPVHVTRARPTPQRIQIIWQKQVTGSLSERKFSAVPSCPSLRSLRYAICILN